MKRITLLTTLIVVLLTGARAQVPPQAFNYSAIARNASGEPIAMSTIGIQISILENSTVGNIVYSENHFVNTDSFGLFNLIIGTGAVQSGLMSHIDWAGDNHYLKVGMDIAGGTNFKTMGVTQFLSVPYALHARTADSVTGTIPGVVLQAGSNVTITGTGTTADPYIVNAIAQNNLNSPTVQTGQATNIQPLSARISGTVNANGLMSNVSFEYGKTTSYGASATPSPAIATGNSTTNFSVNLSNLSPGTIYHYRINAQNAVNVSYGNDMSFTTPATAPTIDTNNVYAFDTLSPNNTRILRFAATVNAHGIPTTVTFEYGTTSSLGNSISASPISSLNPTGVSVFATIPNTPNTTYFYRVNAVNSVGTTSRGGYFYTTRP